MNSLYKTIVLLLLASCASPSGESTDAAEKGPDSREVVLPSDRLASAGITFGTIEPHMLSYDINARGQIILLPDQRAQVSVLMGGTIQSIRVRYGQKVSKGQVLATYTHPAIVEAQQLYINARLKRDMMEQEYKRQEALWKDKVKSDKEFQATRMEYEGALADFNASRAKVVMLNIDPGSLDRGEVKADVPIVSPIAGQVEDIFVSLGQFVDTHTPLFLVIDRSAPVLQLKVFEKDIPFIEKGQRVTFASTASGLEDMEAEIFNVGSVVDPNARTISVMAAITGQGSALVPGMFVASTVHTSEQYLNALPETAVVIENETTRFGFYTPDPEGSAELHFFPFLLKTGFTEEGYVQVEPLEELPEGARVVLTGVYYLKSEMMKNLGD